MYCESCGALNGETGEERIARMFIWIEEATENCIYYVSRKGNLFLCQFCVHALELKKQYDAVKGKPLQKKDERLWK